ncbi:MAG: tmpC [Actinomycetia bacterium]|nr:tmpC [Actinomycetes bacterium]
MRKRTKLSLVAPMLVLSLIASAFVSEAAFASPSTPKQAAPCPGTQGCTPKAPTGKGVKIGVLSGGDTNDHGYYESFIVSAKAYAKKKGWTLSVTDRVAPAAAAEDARSLCRQGVKFVALADSASTDAIPVAAEPVCKGVVFYINGNAKLTPYVFNTTDSINESQVAAGYATGLVMKAKKLTKGAYISGPDLDFVTQAFNGWTAGIKLVVPKATTSKTLTGDFDDSALGQEAAKAQLANGAQILYPYMGGATDAVAKAGAAAKVLSVAPGTDRCSDKSFVVSSLFPPGDYFTQALQDWSAGKVKMGSSLVFKVGVDKVPSVKVCPTAPNAKAIQTKVNTFMKQIASGKVNPAKIVKNSK